MPQEFKKTCFHESHFCRPPLSFCPPCLGRLGHSGPHDRDSEAPVAASANPTPGETDGRDGRTIFERRASDQGPVAGATLERGGRCFADDDDGLRESRRDSSRGPRVLPGHHALDQHRKRLRFHPRIASRRRRPRSRPTSSGGARGRRSCSLRAGGEDTIRGGRFAMRLSAAAEAPHACCSNVMDQGVSGPNNRSSSHREGTPWPPRSSRQPCCRQRKPR